MWTSLKKSDLVGAKVLLIKSSWVQNLLDRKERSLSTLHWHRAMEKCIWGKGQVCRER